ncbi:putative polynucleotide adenylyltransferase [Helianthus annuus]|uniref:Polynucleotide adenylyltransferase n=1 Tax=Helianthus annuus TaxID=4232 RepID=A0A9K3JDY2_HELAN|nr:putative polynucleotide adenylyltransferase [Helianthus annuus]KAJ0942596.1 putative polynucleotide adenylyltransferase [Helianthus annuus]
MNLHGKDIPSDRESKLVRLLARQQRFTENKTYYEPNQTGLYDREDDWNVLIKKAETFELTESQKLLVNREQLRILEKLLNDAYVIRRPKPSEYENRKQVIRVLNDIAKDLYGNSASCPVVEEFGSFSMDFFTPESDLDLSINFPNSPLVFPREQKIKTLRKFSKKLYSLQSAGRVQNVQPVMRAKVPILKFVDTATGVECDISVENTDGISKSLIIRYISSIDERFRKLSLLMKAWAKAQDINSPKDQTLSSLSIILLVAFHLQAYTSYLISVIFIIIGYLKNSFDFIIYNFFWLKTTFIMRKTYKQFIVFNCAIGLIIDLWFQTRDPPILPPFSAILKDGDDPASVKNSVRGFQNYGRRNTETLGELFVTFLIKLASVEKLWPKGLCASPYLGHWSPKTWDNKIAIMSVEDFFDRAQNVARAVGKLEVKIIHELVHLTIQNLGRFMNVNLDELKLKESLFGIDGMHSIVVEQKLNAWKQSLEKKTTKTKLITNNVYNPNGASPSTRPLPTGHLGVPQRQAVTAGLETPWAHQSFYQQPMMGTTGVAGGVPANQWWETAWGGPVWTQGWGGGPGGSSTGGWGAANGAAFTNGRSQETQPATDPWGRRQQQPPYGNSSNAHGTTYR